METKNAESSTNSAGKFVFIPDKSRKVPNLRFSKRTNTLRPVTFFRNWEEDLPSTAESSDSLQNKSRGELITSPKSRKGVPLLQVIAESPIPVLVASPVAQPLDAYDDDEGDSEDNSEEDAPGETQSHLQSHLPSGHRSDKAASESIGHKSQADVSFNSVSDDHPGLDLDNLVSSILDNLSHDQSHRSFSKRDPHARTDSPKRISTVVRTDEIPSTLGSQHLEAHLSSSMPSHASISPDASIREPANASRSPDLSPIAGPSLVNVSSLPAAGTSNVCTSPVSGALSPVPSNAPSSPIIDPIPSFAAGSRGKAKRPRASAQTSMLKTRDTLAYETTPARTFLKMQQLSKQVSPRPASTKTPALAANSIVVETPDGLPVKPVPRKRKVVKSKLTQAAQPNTELQARHMLLCQEEGVSRNASDLTELDVVLTTIKSVASQFLEELDNPESKKAINLFIEKVEKTLHETIFLAHKTKKLKSSDRRSRKYLSKRRPELLDLKTQARECQAQLAEAKQQVSKQRHYQYLSQFMNQMQKFKETMHDQTT